MTAVSARTTTTGTLRLGTRASQLATTQSRAVADAIPLEMAPGDVILHAISAPHGSRANDSNTLRRVFYVHFMVREVLETLHPEWVGKKLGFDERGLERARAMLEERERAGRVLQQLLHRDAVEALIPDFLGVRGRA